MTIEGIPKAVTKIVAKLDKLDGKDGQIKRETYNTYAAAHNLPLVSDDVIGESFSVSDIEAELNSSLIDKYPDADEKELNKIVKQEYKDVKKRAESGETKPSMGIE